MTIVELCVHMCCSGCEARIRKSLAKLRGVDTVDIDMPLQKVTVTGYADQKKILKAVRKSGRRAVLWPSYQPNYGGPFNHQHYNHNRHHAANYSTGTVVVNPFAYSTASSSSYNYRKHGYDESIVHGYYGAPASYGGIVGERAGAMFSDDNPNACSIM